MPGNPQSLHLSYGNGQAQLSWSPPTDSGGSRVNGYVVTLRPTYSDRLPNPSAPGTSTTYPASVDAVSVTGLLEDCHQRYSLSVAARNAAGTGAPATASSFRPSGIVTAGQPPYVVILLDGINEAQPNFAFDPYHPTADGLPSYCPESWNASKQAEQEADFKGSGAGPWSFFHKWNVGEVASDGSGAASGDQYTSIESVPRTLPNNPYGKPADTPTHSFMLDAIAAQGAIILPFSYKGVSLKLDSAGNTAFHFNGYSTCDSGLGSPPSPVPNPYCNPDVGGFERTLNDEITSAASFWPSSKIVVVGHSQGGMVAWKWWQDYSHPQNLVAGFSLDSPINGGCVSIGPCVGPVGYPGWDTRVYSDGGELNTDGQFGNNFHFVGTYGDSLPVGPFHLYGGSGAENLEHNLLFPYGGINPFGLQVDQVESRCSNPSDESNCPAPSPPDHISECPIVSAPTWEEKAAHFVVKFCPGNVDFFDHTLGLSYFNPTARPSFAPTTTTTQSCGRVQLTSAVTSHVSQTTQYTPNLYTISNIKTAGSNPEWASFGLQATAAGAATFQGAIGVAECTNSWQVKEIGGYAVGCNTVPTSLQGPLGISCPPNSTTPTQPTFTPFVGSWYVHGGGLVIGADGTFSISERSYQWCPGSPGYDPAIPNDPSMPCDSQGPDGNIIGGYTASGRLDAVQGDTSTGHITDGTGFSVGPVTFVYDPSRNIVTGPTSGGNPSGNFCGPSAPSGVCGA